MFNRIWRRGSIEAFRERWRTAKELRTDISNSVGATFEMSFLVRRLCSSSKSRLGQEVEYVERSAIGHRLLENPIYNKSSAFTLSERRNLGLTGLLPCTVETLEEQKDRCYDAFSMKLSDLEKHIYLRQLQDTNEVLFYSLIQDHISEMMPILYTPTVGQACINFSNIFRRSRGIYLAYPHRHEMSAVFETLAVYGWTGAPTDIDTNFTTSVVVVTDGGRILGLGDLGAHGMGISIGKCSLYTGIGGLPGWETLPVLLDVGTNNKALRESPHYIGWRHERLDWNSPEYREFIDIFVQNIKKYMPGVLVQWEDFNIHCATPILNHYREQLCTFNDDIQGTAVVTLGTLIAACAQVNRKLSEQKVIIAGSGSAGCGIAKMIRNAMMEEGLSTEEAGERIFMIDRDGLVHDGIENLMNLQRPLAQKLDGPILSKWSKRKNGAISWSLLEVVDNAKPDIMVGVSGVNGLFTEDVVKAMNAQCAPNRPIIFPLSNPTAHVEADPEDLMRWTDNSAIIATGTAFPPTLVTKSVSKYRTTTLTRVHTQCNNAYVFPGIGLACKAVNPTQITDSLLMTAARALAETSPAKTKSSDEPLLPPLSDVIRCSKHVAHRVAARAVKDGIATKNMDKSDDELRHLVNSLFWKPKYKPVEVYAEKKQGGSLY